MKKEAQITNEIWNQDVVESGYVVRMKKAVKTEGRYYIFMEYCNGGDLKELFTLRGCQLSTKVIHKIMVQLGKGCTAMAAQLIMHRDLKLQNIMIHFPRKSDALLKMDSLKKQQFLASVDLEREEFEVKIADFGFSKRLQTRSQLNKTICGTPLYMAPQVVQRKLYTSKADVWSLGIIFFELLTGSTPFKARNKQEFEDKVKECKLYFPEEVHHKLTLEGLYFLSQCLAQNEIDRKSFDQLCQHPYLSTDITKQRPLH